MAQIRDGEGIKPSKKYSNGSIHENASGQFQVLDRYLDTEDNNIYLKIQWLNTGDIEVNKEVNIAASIWKYQKSRGIEEPRSTVISEGVSLQDLYDINLQILHRLDEHAERLIEEQDESDKIRQKDFERIERMQDIMYQQHEGFQALLSQVHTLITQVDDLHKRYDLATKLVEKI